MAGRLWHFQHALGTTALTVRNHRGRGPVMAGFVVRATTAHGERTWIARPSSSGFPVLGSRATADVFKTKVEAYAAIEQMPYTLGMAGMKFVVEPAERG